LNIQVVKWTVNVLMGITFLTSFITGILKFSLLMRLFGLTDVILPLARISDIHDWFGLALGIMVGIHLFLNRKWIVVMTKKIVTSPNDRP